MLRVHPGVHLPYAGIVAGLPRVIAGYDLTDDETTVQSFNGRKGKDLAAQRSQHFGRWLKRHKRLRHCSRVAEKAYRLVVCLVSLNSGRRACLAAAMRRAQNRELSLCRRDTRRPVPVFERLTRRRGTGSQARWIIDHCVVSLCAICRNNPLPVPKPPQAQRISRMVKAPLANS